MKFCHCSSFLPERDATATIESADVMKCDNMFHSSFYVVAPTFQAPLSEEFVFRACMLPILVPALGEGWSVVVCPLLFGVGKVTSLACLHNYARTKSFKLQWPHMSSCT